MQSREKGNLIFVRLFPGEKILEGLKEICQKHRIKTAVVLSGLGQIRDFKLGFFKEKGNYLPEDFSQPQELLFLTGNVSEQNSQGSKYEFHLHAVLGNEKKGVVGGHFLEGTVSVTGEIVLLKTDLEIKRKLEETTGLRGLFLED